jgi:hypothetical protein
MELVKASFAFLLALGWAVLVMYGPGESAALWFVKLHEWGLTESAYPTMKDLKAWPSLMSAMMVAFLVGVSVYFVVEVFERR